MSQIPPFLPKVQPLRHKHFSGCFGKGSECWDGCLATFALLYSCFIVTEELYKKCLHDPDDHDRVITHLEPDILECEVKWALGSITTNKSSGGDGIPVELFQILKDDAVKELHSIYQQIWKTQQWPQDWKRSVFIWIPKKGNAKECSNYTQLHTSHMLAK